MKVSSALRNSVYASILAVAATGSASAAIVTLNSVVGQWSSATPSTQASGIGTDEIRWGIPNAGSGNGQQSGYRFDGAAPPAQILTEGAPTALGTFTHFNYVINIGTNVTAATLDLTFGLTIDGISQALTNSYNFVHWETDNEDNPCGDGGQVGVGVNSNGCADRVQATLNNAIAEKFTINGTEYTIDITGFDIADRNGIPTFWTVEEQSNSAKLYGSLTEYVPAPVPVPAAGWMILAGLGGLATARRRKKTI